MFGSKKKIWSWNFLGQNFLGSKKCLGQKIFWVKKYFGSKRFLAKFGQKDFDPKFFCLKKNLVGLTQGGGYMTPPPKKEKEKIVGLDCC